MGIEEKISNEVGKPLDIFFPVESVITTIQNKNLTGDYEAGQAAVLPLGTESVITADHVNEMWGFGRYQKWIKSQFL